MNKEKIQYYANIVIVLLGVVLFLYFGFTKLLFLALPFLISWGVAFAVRPVSCKLSEKIKLPRKWISLILTLLIILGGLSLLVGILIYAAKEAWAFLAELAGDERIYDIISKLLNPLSGIFGEHEGALEIEARITEAIKGLISSLLSGFVNFVSSFVSYVPGVFIFLVTTVISAVYFSLELDFINQKVKSSLPEKLSRALVNFKNKFLVMGLRYLRSYLTITLVVFFVMLAGFLALRVEYAILLAVIFALLDMLPLIGIGTFMIPWAIFEIIFSNAGVGIGLIVLFILTELIRNLIEPKILGKNLGIHPILTLVLLYASYSLFGFLGLLLIPILTVILNVVLEKNNSAEVGKGGGGE